jgi:hypothetical protein
VVESIPLDCRLCREFAHGPRDAYGQEGPFCWGCLEREEPYWHVIAEDVMGLSLSRGFWIEKRQERYTVEPAHARGWAQWAPTLKSDQAEAAQRKFCADRRLVIAQDKPLDGGQYQVRFGRQGGAPYPPGIGRDRSVALCRAILEVLHHGTPEDLFAGDRPKLDFNARRWFYGRRYNQEAKREEFFRFKSEEQRDRWINVGEETEYRDEIGFSYFDVGRYPEDAEDMTAY